MAGRLQEAAENVKRRLQPDALTERQRRLWSVFTFLAKFAAFALPVYVVIDSQWNAPLLRATIASVSTTLLGAVGLEAVHSGTAIHAPGIIVDVSRDSTGWKSLMAFTGLVLATTRPYRRKIGGIVLGAAVVFAANVFRIVSMVYANVVYGIDYQVMHLFLWRWGLTAVVLVTWLAWLNSSRILETRRIVPDIRS